MTSNKKKIVSLKQSTFQASVHEMMTTAATFGDDTTISTDTGPLVLYSCQDKEFYFRFVLLRIVKYR